MLLCTEWCDIGKYVSLLFGENCLMVCKRRQLCGELDVTGVECRVLSELSYPYHFLLLILHYFHILTYKFYSTYNN